MFEARRQGIGHKLETAICWRLDGLWQRLRGVLVRWQAGTLRPPRPRAVRAGDGARPEREAARPWGERQRYWRGVMPGRFGWLRGLLGPRTGGACVGFIEPLGSAEMAAILAAAPQVARILRPFYRFLGIELPAELRLAKRKKDTSPRPSPQGGEGEEGCPPPRQGGGGEKGHVAHPSPRPPGSSPGAGLPSRGEGEKKKELPPHPDAAWFPDTPAAREAARYLARVQAGLPVKVEKLSSVALGYILHSPRGELLVPHEISYALPRRRWRDSKKSD